MKIPSNVLIIIAMAIIVLAVLTSMFVLLSGQQISEAEAQRIFNDRCVTLCGKQTLDGLGILAEQQPDWILACHRLFGSDYPPNACLYQCGAGCAVASNPCDLLELKSRTFGEDFCEYIKSKKLDVYSNCNCKVVRR